MKPGRPDSRVRYPSCSYHLFNFIFCKWLIVDLFVLYFDTFFLRLFIVPNPSLSTCPFVLAFIQLLCSAACWLCEELVQSCLKPWQNANVVLCTASLTNCLCMCLCVCMHVCAWYSCVCVCLTVASVSSCVKESQSWISKANSASMCMCSVCGRRSSMKVCVSVWALTAYVRTTCVSRGQNLILW